MFFDGFTDEELTKLERVGQFKAFKKGEALLKEGENGTAFALILKGKVEVRKNISREQYKVIVELKDFDLIGELGFFDASSRTATVVAIEDTEILEFNRKNFELFTETNVEIGCKVYKNMARILADRLASNDATLMDTIVWVLGRPSYTSADPDPDPDTTIRNHHKLKILRG